MNYAKMVQVAQERDALAAEGKLQIAVELTWRERLLSWPWRPWRSTYSWIDWNARGMDYPEQLGWPRKW